MKYLGIDYGAKRIGMSVSDGGGSIAFPRGVIPNDASVLDAVIEMIEKEKIARIVVGDTRTVHGRDNPVTKEAENFIAQLEEKTGLAVVKAFEAWSSIEASRYAEKGNEHDDAAAAAIILQRYLEMHAGSVE